MFHRPPPALQPAGQWLTHTCLALCRVDVGGWTVCSEAPHCLPPPAAGSHVCWTTASTRGRKDCSRSFDFTASYPLEWLAFHTTNQIPLTTAAHLETSIKTHLWEKTSPLQVDWLQQNGYNA